MVDELPRNGWFVWFSLGIALLMSIAPIPEFMAVGRPLWLPLMVSFWLLMAPQKIGMTRIWLLGLVSDVLCGTLLGYNALLLSLLVSMVLSLQQRLRLFPLWQQSLALLVLFGLVQLVQLWLDSLGGNRAPSLLALLPALVSALLWPWITAVMQFFCRRLHVY